MNYQLNHERFTDDWSICVVRTSTQEKEKKEEEISVLVWRFCPTGSVSREKGGGGFIIGTDWTFPPDWDSKSLYFSLPH